MTNILVVFKKNFESVHDKSLETIKHILLSVQEEKEIRIDIRAREQVRRADFIGRDLVIVLGGDGTLTSISHNIDANTPVMGVNSHPRGQDPEGSYGFYMDCDVDTFEDDIHVALSGNAIINDVPRLQAVIDTTSGNRFTTDPAMNDLLIANTHQYAPSKYHLRRGASKCRQQSSGLLFSTWLGQGAWLNHTVDLETIERLRKRIKEGDWSDHYLFVARDIPHNQRIGDPWHWIDWTSDATILTSDMHRGYVVPDGWDEVHFNRGATITVSTEAPRLSILTFRKTLAEKLEDIINS